MMAKKAALDKTGGFDERFYMYAEDIDLSHRIRQKGFKNYYLASTSIIHFKGESSPRDLRRLKLFYKAMSQFTGKHFRSYAGGLNLFLMKAAIWAGAGVAAAHAAKTDGEGICCWDGSNWLIHVPTPQRRPWLTHP